MADSQQILPIQLYSKPGIKRDGTVYEGNNYIDGKWCRFQRGLPRKMGGYRTLTNLVGGISRGLSVYSKNNQTYVHSGCGSYLEQFTIDPNGVTSGIVDRTPAGFAANANNQWQFDTIYSSTGTAVKLLAIAMPNALDISDSTERPIYYGDVTGNTALTATGLLSVSGGLFVMHPYVFSFGNDGIVNWSAANDPNTPSNSARPTSTKIVRGLPLRAGAGNGPSGLMWSLDSLLNVSFVGGSTVFNFGTISSQSSILSAASVIEYDGIYFWVGIDRFLMFNGVVRELPNDMNINDFFDNLNFTYANKVFATKVPRYGEIWWCYPRGNSTECNHAVIYNVRENVWYDTELPGSGRSAAAEAQVFRSPLMAGIDVHPTSSKYRMWQHEFGSNEIDGANVLAVESFFETAEFSFVAADEPLQGTQNTSAIVNRIEPDFIQVGDMTCQAHGRWNARSPEMQGAIHTFPASASNASQQTITIRENMRQIRFRFSSNVQDGDYQMGKPLMHIQPGDGRITS